VQTVLLDIRESYLTVKIRSTLKSVRPTLHSVAASITGQNVTSAPLQPSKSYMSQTNNEPEEAEEPKIRSETHCIVRSKINYKSIKCRTASEQPANEEVNEALRSEEEPRSRICIITTTQFQRERNGNGNGHGNVKWTWSGSPAWQNGCDGAVSVLGHSRTETVLDFAETDRTFTLGT